MAKFNVGQTVYTKGSNIPGVIQGIRETKRNVWYSLDNGMTHCETNLWDGIGEKLAFCSQLVCQRKIDLLTEIEGQHWVKDEYGNAMCIHHEGAEWNADFFNAFKN